jgi:hypothetical protein
MRASGSLLRQARQRAIDRIIHQETVEQYHARALLEVANILVVVLLKAMTPNRRVMIGKAIVEEMATLEANLAKLRIYAGIARPVSRRPRGPRNGPNLETTPTTKPLA